MTRGGLLVLGVLLVACGGREAVVVAPPPAASTAPAAAPGQCQLTLQVGRIETRSTCTIDERVSGHAAPLVYPCNGGEATAAFGESVFEGSVEAGEVDISIETAFRFTDGCTWRSKQRIFGSLADPLRYEYEETPEAGQTGCAAGCLANAVVNAR